MIIKLTPKELEDLIYAADIAGQADEQGPGEVNDHPARVSMYARARRLFKLRDKMQNFKRLNKKPRAVSSNS